MLSIPFLKMPTRVRSKRRVEELKPDPSEIVSQASRALADGGPSRALLMVAPWRNDPEAPAKMKLIAARALSALGRYPEAIGRFVEYLDSNPGDAEGLVWAGLAAAKARETARAMEWFNRATYALDGRARAILEAFTRSEGSDPLAIEDMVAEAEAHPEDRDRALALACALGRGGHFRAVEGFLGVLNRPRQVAPGSTSLTLKPFPEKVESE